MKRLTIACGTSVVLAMVATPIAAWQTEPADEPRESAPAEERQQEESVQVARAVACLEVKDREPVSIDTVFSNHTEQIYCWTHVEGASDPTDIQHVWIREGEEMARVTLPVRSASWRTYSSKKMLPTWTGAWKVEVRDAANNLLKTVEFTVTEAETGRPAGEAEVEGGGEGGKQ